MCLNLLSISPALANKCLFALRGYSRVHELQQHLPDEVKKEFITEITRSNRDGLLEFEPFRFDFFHNSPSTKLFMDQMARSVSEMANIRHSEETNPEHFKLRVIASYRIISLHLLYFNAKLPELRAYAAQQIFNELKIASDAYNILASSQPFASSAFATSLITPQILTIAKEVFPNLTWPFPPKQGGLLSLFQKSSRDLYYLENTMSAQTAILTEAVDFVHNLQSRLIAGDDISVKEAGLLSALSKSLLEYADVNASDFPSLPFATRFFELKEDFESSLASLNNVSTPYAKHLYDIIQLRLDPDNSNLHAAVLKSSILLKNLREFFPPREKAPSNGDPAEHFKLIDKVDVDFELSSTAEFSETLNYLVKNHYMKAAVSFLGNRSISQFDPVRTAQSVKCVTEYSLKRLRYYTKKSLDPNTNQAPSEKEIERMFFVMKKMEAFLIGGFNVYLQELRSQCTQNASPELVRAIDEWLKVT